MFKMFVGLKMLVRGLTELHRYNRPKRFRCVRHNAIRAIFLLPRRRLISRSSSKVSRKVSTAKSVVQSLVIRAILPYRSSSKLSSKVSHTKSVVKAQ